MADNTILNSGTGGDTIRTEDLGNGLKIAVSKIYLGTHGVDGGPVTGGNPLPVGGTVTAGVTSLPSLPAGTSLIGQASISQQVNTLMSGTTPLTIQRAVINFNLSGNTTIVAAVAGKQVIVLKWDFQVGGAANVKFRDFDGASTYADLTGPFPMLANQPRSGAYSPAGHFVTAPGHALAMSSDAAVQVSGYLVYVVA